MNAVLYTHQLEPITVIDVPMHRWESLARGEPLEIAIFSGFTLKHDYSDPVERHVRKVVITGEVFQRRGHAALMLFTRDEEHALLLKAAFLPGQRGEVQSRERRAFTDGFLHALIDPHR